MVSIVGIWPRFIEPRLLSTTRLTLPLKQMPVELEELKILHFSDLHWQAGFSHWFREKFIRKVNALHPDLILFTGDFISCSHLEDSEGLLNILKSLRAKIGKYAVFGNHDYSQFVTVNEKGDYDIEEESSEAVITKGFKRLFKSVPLTKQIAPRVKAIKTHTALNHLLQNSGFILLNNETLQVAYKQKKINICGLGEYSLGKCEPDLAFREYDERYPGIILAHNPDVFPRLKDYPGELILSGHTHGGQVNLPWIWKRLTKMEHMKYKRGLKKVGNKWAYVNRGISSVMPFRWFSSPELTLIRLKVDHEC